MIFLSYYVFDCQRGEIKIYGRQPSNLFFNASACNEKNICASAKIKVKIVAPDDGEGIIAIIFFIGGTAFCFFGSSFACFIGARQLCNKPRSRSYTSTYDDMELMPLFGQEEKNYRIPLSSLKFLTNNKGEKEVLGSGGFGTVYKATYRTKKMTRLVAVKKINMNILRKEGIEVDVKRQIILGRNEHSNLVRLSSRREGQIHVGNGVDG